MLLSVVIPVFNEAEGLPILLGTVRSVLEHTDCEYELVFVNDGSSDETFRVLTEAAAKDRRIKALGFSRNFGHQAAITAGLDFASGGAVVVMDADLQDPPELLPQMLELFKQGYDVVSPKRISRQGETLFKRCTAALFYRALAREGEVVYRASPYAAGAKPVAFNFDWSFDYYPLAYARPGPAITVYRLHGGRCGR